MFEDSKHEEPKSAELNIGTNSVGRSESPQRDELDISQPKVDSLEETIDNAMEVSSVETTEDLTNKELGSQSQESLAPVPMEVDQRIPSSGVSSGEQTPDNSQTPTVLVSNEREGLEMKQTTVEDSEKENNETSGEDAKEKEETGNSEQEKLACSDVASEPCTEEKVGGETSANMDKLAEQETVLNVEKPKEEENSETSELEKTSAEDNAREESEALADNKDVEENAATSEKPKDNAEPEKMEIDTVSAEDGEAVQVDKTTSDDSSTPTTNAMTTTAETVAVPAQSPPAVETRRPPLTVEQQAKKKELMDRCILALEYCLRRFPQHHKSRYRLAYVYYYSPEHKVTQQFLK